MFPGERELGNCGSAQEGEGEGRWQHVKKGRCTESTLRSTLALLIVGELISADGRGW